MVWTLFTRRSSKFGHLFYWINRWFSLPVPVSIWTDFTKRTRMHSSRMRTGRSSTVCRRLLPGGACLLWGGVCSQGVCVCSQGGGVSALGGVCSQGGGVCSQGGCLLWWVSAPGVCTGGCLLPEGGLLRGVCSGGVCSQGASAPRGGVYSGGVCSRGMSAPGGVCSQGCLLLRGVSAPGGVCLSACWDTTPREQTPPLWTEWQTGAKILPWPQLRCSR